MSAFSVWIGIGIACGLAWINWYGQKIERTTMPQIHRRINVALIVLIGALIGSRLGYVVVNWEYFQTHVFEVFEIWQGGLTAAGAYLGGAVTFFGYSWLRGFYPGDLLDGLLPLILMVTLTTWLACWQAGVAYGNPVDAVWGVLARDEWGEVTKRVPVQLIGAVLTVLTFWLADSLNPWYKTTGQKAALGLSLLTAQFCGLTFLRADPAPVWHGLRVDTWLWMVVCGFSVATLVVRIYFSRGVAHRPSLLRN